MSAAKHTPAPTIVRLFGIGTWPNAQLSCGCTEYSIHFRHREGDAYPLHKCDKVTPHAAATFAAGAL